MNDAKLPLGLKIYFTVLASAVLASVVRAVATRTAEDFFFYVSIWAFIWFSYLLHLSFSLAKAFGRPPPTPSFRHFLRILIYTYALAILSYGVGVDVKDLYLWLSITRYEVLIVFFALGLGLMLFQLRRELRVVYGTSEVVVGLVVAAYRHSPDTSIWNLSEFLPFLTAGVYLVVRGFDNIQQGLTPSQLDPSIRWLMSKLKATDTGSEVPVPVRRIKKKADRVSIAVTMRSRRLLNNSLNRRAAINRMIAP